MSSQPFYCMTGSNADQWSTCSSSFLDKFNERANSNFDSTPLAPASTYSCNCDYNPFCKYCNHTLCPIDCAFKLSSVKWSACDKKTGTFSNEPVVAQYGLHGGHQCPTWVESNCKVDCEFREPSTWSPCDTSGSMSNPPRITYGSKFGGTACPSYVYSNCPVPCSFYYGPSSPCSPQGTLSNPLVVTRSSLYGGTPCPASWKTSTCPYPCTWSNDVTKNPWSICSSNGTFSNQAVVVTPAINGGPCVLPWATSNCPFDCVGNFLPWSQCTGPCGSNNATMMRTFKVDLEAKNGGRCPFVDGHRQSQPCTVSMCPVDCRQTPWTDAGTCTRPCQFSSIIGSNLTLEIGSNIQTRRVISREEYGGAACGPSERWVPCNTQACAVPTTSEIPPLSNLTNYTHALTLQSYFSDPQASPLFYWISQNPMSNASIVGNSLAFVSGAYRGATYRIEISASNIWKLQSSLTVLVTEPPPLLTAIKGTYTFKETPLQSFSLEKFEKFDLEKFEKFEKFDLEKFEKFDLEKFDGVALVNRDSNGFYMEQSLVNRVKLPINPDTTNTQNTRDLRGKVDFGSYSIPFSVNPDSNSLELVQDKRKKSLNYAGPLPDCLGTSNCSSSLLGGRYQIDYVDGTTGTGYVYSTLDRVMVLEDKGVTTPISWDGVTGTTGRGDVFGVVALQSPNRQLVFSTNRYKTWKYLGPQPPIDCTFSPTPWSSCSSTGTMSNLPTVSPELYGGKPCTSQAYSWTSSNCPKNCVGYWDPWSSCSTTCGLGEQTRVYRVTQPSFHGGLQCPYSNSEVGKQSCIVNCGNFNDACNAYLNMYPDVKDAKVNPWTHYQTSGNREGRTWPQTNPGPGTDDYCAGSYGNWGSCSVLCGGGTQSRTFSRVRDGSPFTSCSLPANLSSSSQICNSDACPSFVRVASTKIENYIGSSRTFGYTIVVDVANVTGSSVGSFSAANKQVTFTGRVSPNTIPSTGAFRLSGVNSSFVDVASQPGTESSGPTPPATQPSVTGSSVTTYSTYNASTSSYAISSWTVSTANTTSVTVTSYGGFSGAPTAKLSGNAISISGNVLASTTPTIKFDLTNSVDGYVTVTRDSGIYTGSKSPTPVNCAGSWSGFGTCTKSCGGGTESQTYSVTTAAANGGTACPATHGQVETRTCNTQACPVNCVGSWSGFGACSKSCGTGTQSQTYIVTTAAANGGSACPATHGQVNTQTCNTQACVNCVGSWSGFGACSKSCGGGTQSQTYSVTTAAGPGGSACPHANGQVNTQTCNTQGCPVNCVGSWSGFGACSKSCGGGTRSQTYTVTTAAANGGSACPHTNGQVDTQQCNTQGCPVNCVGSWSGFGGCSKSCGGGTQSRTYTVTTAAANGGSACPHTNGQVDTQTCNTQACPVNCVGSWSGFGGCSKSCGTGTQSQTYSVTTAAANGGSACPYTNNQVNTQNCNTQGCPVNCVGSWSGFGGCSKSCGGGTQSRTYTVTTAAANGGSACPYANGQVDTQQCNTQACGVSTTYNYYYEMANEGGSWYGVDSITFTDLYYDGVARKANAFGIPNRLIDTDGWDYKYFIRWV